MFLTISCKIYLFLLEYEHFRPRLIHANRSMKSLYYDNVPQICDECVRKWTIDDFLRLKG